MTKSTNSGAVRVLVFAYGILAFAAIGRSSFELATKFSVAPLPYSLSAIAAVFYVLATVGLIRKGAGWRKFAQIAISLELFFVVSVGVLTLIDSSLFPAKTVWSNFGEGYGFTPLVLPILGLIWLRKESKK
ncbi:MAG: hypothetical protein ORN27_00960 [Rhodoluna sp.]|nr:hypothetical protein [Rhodoluna sp.]